MCALTTCLSAALRARKQLGAPSLLRVESTVCFQRKRGLPSSVKTKAGQVRLVVHWEFCCVLCALTTCLSAALRARKQLGAPSLLRRKVQWTFRLSSAASA
nr:hypothetical protein CJ211_05615 [Gardnerella vaginalis]PMC53458.1 hypothetical protein CJ210_00240 [Gardnerella vaginalis]